MHEHSRHSQDDVNDKVRTTAEFVAQMMGWTISYEPAPEGSRLAFVEGLIAQGMSWHEVVARYPDYDALDAGVAEYQERMRTASPSMITDNPASNSLPKS